MMKVSRFVRFEMLVENLQDQIQHLTCNHVLLHTLSGYKGDSEAITVFCTLRNSLAFIFSFFFHSSKMQIHVVKEADSTENHCQEPPLSFLFFIFNGHDVNVNSTERVPLICTCVLV